MIESISMGELYAGNTLYLDYIAGTGAAGGFFTHAPLDFTRALGNRQRQTYPRQEISQLLGQYNAGLGAHTRAIANIKAIEDQTTFCVITGQQAGFLGGPVYTLYKILTTIRLAEYLQTTFHKTVIPLFWLADEDHDFNEINHVNFIKSDGEVGRISFKWEHAGHPIADLSITSEVAQAFNAYFEGILPGKYLEQAKRFFSPEPDENFCTWNARTWSRLFSAHGLVIVRPEVVRKPARKFALEALKYSEAIRNCLNSVAQRLSDAGYTPAISSPEAGKLFTFDPSGRRIRVEDSQAFLNTLEKKPDRFSVDVVLRPLLADTLLPVVVNVLGPGEVCYHAMLKPIYALFNLQQPLLFPRKSYTIVASQEAKLIDRYLTTAAVILTRRLDVESTFQHVVPESEMEIFDGIRCQLTKALSPLLPHLASIDPNLTITYQQTLASVIRSLDKLKDRALRAQLSKQGFSKGAIQRLRNSLLPKERPQERVLPLPHFLNRHGTDFIDTMFTAGKLTDFDHHIFTIEHSDA